MKEYKKALNFKNEKTSKDFQALFYNGRGYTKTKLKLFEDAIKDFDEAIKFNSEEVDIYINRGIAKNELGNFNEAIKDFNTAIELDEDNENTYLNRAISYFD